MKNTLLALTVNPTPFSIVYFVDAPTDIIIDIADITDQKGKTILSALSPSGPTPFDMRNSSPKYIAIYLTYLSY